MEEFETENEVVAIHLQINFTPSYKHTVYTMGAQVLIDYDYLHAGN